MVLALTAAHSVANRKLDMVIELSQGAFYLCPDSQYLEQIHGLQIAASTFEPLKIEVS